MDQLSLPSINPKLKEVDDKTMIFDPIRKKYIQLTPEEWVRQHFVQYLIEEYQYPKSLITVEQGLKYNSLQKRTDIVVFNRAGKPLLLVECKAVKIRLNQKVMEQAMMYNKSLEAPYIVVTNGLEHACMFLDKGASKVDFLPKIPYFEDIA